MEERIGNDGPGDRDPSNPLSVPRLPLFTQRWNSGRNYPVEGDEDWQRGGAEKEADGRRGDNTGLDNNFGSIAPSRFAKAPEFWLLPSQRLVCV